MTSIRGIFRALLALLCLPACPGIEVGLDDDAEEVLDCISGMRDCEEEASSHASADDDGEGDDSDVAEASDSDDTNNDDSTTTSGDDDELDGFVILDNSRKGDQRYLMGTYVNYRYYYGGYDWTMPWHLPVAVRAYSHANDPMIDFEDADGNLLWIAVANDVGFDFESEVTVNGIERDFDCSCQISYDNWACTCDLEDSSTEYSLEYNRMGLDPEDVHDGDEYEGIQDEREYVLGTTSSSACEYKDYALPDDIAVKYRGETIDFEDDEGELLWSADLHEDETFDFTVEGFANDYGQPNVDLGCTCNIYTAGLSGSLYELTLPNDLYCYCNSTEGVDCDVTYY